MRDLNSEAIERIGQIVRDRRAQSVRSSHPLGLFLLVGPDEADARFIARTIAESEFGGPDALLRLDMREYKEKHELWLLVGSPPGIIGYGPPGVLIEAVRLRPDQVILFEWIERAHTDAQNLSLQIAEEASLCDSRGRHVDFRSTIILLMTKAGVLPRQVLRSELLGLFDGVFDFADPRSSDPS